MRKSTLPLWGTLVILLSGCPSQPDVHLNDTSNSNRPPVSQGHSRLLGPLSKIKALSDIPTVINLIEETIPYETMSSSDLATLGDLFLSQNRLDDAARAFQSALVKDPKDVYSQYSLALVAGAQGKTEEQRLVLNQIVKKNPTHAPSLAALGRLAQEENKIIEARDFYERSLASGASEEAFVGLGLLEMEKGSPQRSVELLTQAKELYPNSEPVAALRAAALGNEDKVYDAEREYTRAISLDPKGFWNYLDRGRLRWLKMFKPEEALEDLNKALSIEPDNYHAHLYRGEVNEALGKVPGAYQDFLAVYKATPELRTIYPSLAIFSFTMEDWEVAARAAQLSAQEYPGEYAFPWIAALSLRALGRVRESEQLLDREARRFAPNTTIADTFRFLRNPTSNTAEFTLSNRLKGEPDNLLRTRVQFYMGFVYFVQKSRFASSARAHLTPVSEATIPNVPEIFMAKYLLEQLK